jgi:hypothetical protein
MARSLRFYVIYDQHWNEVYYEYTLHNTKQDAWFYVIPWNVTMEKAMAALNAAKLNAVLECAEKNGWI